MGGRAFPDVEPVPIERITSIVEWYRIMLGLQPSQIALLGSTGKKPLSGDIDLAVSNWKWDYDRLVGHLIARLGMSNVNTQGKNLQQVYTRYTLPDGTKHQVDLMVGDPMLLEFTHWSPHPTSSAYSGTYRTELIKAAAKVNSPHQVFQGSRMIARVGYTLYHDRGLVYSHRWCPPRKDGTGFTAKMVAVTPDTMEEFYQTFPQIPRDDDKVLTDPLLIAGTIFDASVSTVHLNSYETVCSVIRECDFILDKELVWTLYTERLDELKLPHPVRLI